MADFAAPLSAGAPQSVMDYANQQQQFNDVSNLRGIQTATGANDLQAKQRAMQLSMLSGVLNEQDPEKQRAMIGNLVPIANKLNPSYQIDPNVDVPTIRALVQSQVSPEKQAELASSRYNAAMLAGIKTSEIKTDPATGELVRINRLTGEQTPVGPGGLTAEDLAGSNPGMQQGPGGIFPQPPLNTNPVPRPQMGPAAPQIEPAFGFKSSVMTPNQIKAQMPVDAKRLTAFVTNQQKAENVKNILNGLETNVKNFHTGSGGDVRGNVDKLMSLANGDDSEQGLAATNYDNINSLTNNLVTELQGFQAAPGQRGTLLGLQTLINGKPGVNKQLPANLSIINKYRGQIDDYLLTEEIAQQYKDINPAKIIQEKDVNALDTALKKQYPLLTADKNGNFVYNADNADKIRAAIPDAIQHPQDYLSKVTAADHANDRMKPKIEENKPQTPQVVKSQNGVPFLFMGGDPKDKNNYKPVNANEQ